MELSSSSSQKHLFDTSIFNGFRVLFNYAVVYGHIMYFLPIILDKPELPIVLGQKKEPLLSLLSTLMFFLMVYSVDVFLFISGYLFGRSFCLQQANGTAFPYTLRHGLGHIITRFFRLLPVFAIAWATGVARGARSCMNQNVLYELFHVFNFNPMYGKAGNSHFVCLFGTWSLTTDVQAHVFMELVVIFFKSHRRAAQFLCFAVVFEILCRANFLYQLGRPLSQAPTIVSLVSSHEVLSEIASIFNLPVGNASFSGRPGDFNGKMATDMKVYTSPYMRTAPTFIGFLTWYAVEEHTAYVRFIEGNVVLTMFAIFSATLTLLFAFFVVPTLGGSPAWLCTLQESVHRVAFTCIVSAFVVILGSPVVASKSRVIRAVRAMHTNQFVNRIGSLTYAMYLMHPFLLWIGTAIPPKITKQEFEVWRFVSSGLQVYLASVFVSVPCHYVENRFHALRKRMTRRRVSSSEKSTIKED